MTQAIFSENQTHNNKIKQTIILASALESGANSGWNL